MELQDGQREIATFSVSGGICSITPDGTSLLGTAQISNTGVNSVLGDKYYSRVTVTPKNSSLLKIEVNPDDTH